MLKGRVDSNFDSIVPIELLTNDTFRTFEVTIDTGFNGDLVLPQGLISKFGFTYLYSTKKLIWLVTQPKRLIFSKVKLNG